MQTLLPQAPATASTSFTGLPSFFIFFFFSLFFFHFSFFSFLFLFSFYFLIPFPSFPPLFIFARPLRRRQESNK
jgi:hypothetical protein